LGIRCGRGLLGCLSRFVRVVRPCAFRGFYERQLERGWARCEDSVHVLSRGSQSTHGALVPSLARVESGSPSPPRAGASSPGGLRGASGARDRSIHERAGVGRAISFQPAEQPVQLGALFTHEHEETCKSGRGGTSSRCAANFSTLCGSDSMTKAWGRLRER
jgi:hypothetical protein